MPQVCSLCHIRCFFSSEAQYPNHHLSKSFSACSMFSAMKTISAVIMHQRASFWTSFLSVSRTSRNRKKVNINFWLPPNLDQLAFMCFYLLLSLYLCLAQVSHRLMVPVVSLYTTTSLFLVHNYMLFPCHDLPDGDLFCFLCTFPLVVLLQRSYQLLICPVWMQTDCFLFWLFDLHLMTVTLSFMVWCMSFKLL